MSLTLSSPLDIMQPNPWDRDSTIILVSHLHYNTYRYYTHLNRDTSLVFGRPLGTFLIHTQGPPRNSLSQRNVRSNRTSFRQHTSRFATSSTFAIITRFSGAACCNSEFLFPNVNHTHTRNVPAPRSTILTAHQERFHDIDQLNDRISSIQSGFASQNTLVLISSESSARRSNASLPA